VVWVPLLACPAVQGKKTLLDKPAVAPVSQSAITFENSYITSKHNQPNLKVAFEGGVLEPSQDPLRIVNMIIGVMNGPRGSHCSK
jgi:hypothetical protein